MDFEIFVTRGLGDNSYLVSAGKEAFIVDPQRDAWRFLEVAIKKNLEITHVFETHVHNDYISGALEIKKQSGAEIVVPKIGKYEFDHRGVSNGDKITIGDYTIETMASPGHTYEHTSWIAKNSSDKEISIFTGGSLIVGSAGRTDLLGHDHVEPLTHHQFETLQKYHKLDDDIQILPTHGSGSFCTSSNASQVKITTIGNEKQSNLAFQANNYDAFRNTVLNGLKQYPSYYKFMAPINRKGPEVFEELKLPEKLDSEMFHEELANGAYLVDARERINYAKKHIKESLNIELVPSFCSYVGWLVPFNSPIILIVDDPETENLREAITQLFRIGYTDIRGYLPNSKLEDVAMPLGNYDIISFKELCEMKSNGSTPYLLDTRQPIEFETEGRIESSHNLFVTDALSSVTNLSETLKNEEIVTYCVSGQRAVIVGSMLAKEGLKVKVVGDGGINELLKC